MVAELLVRYKRLPLPNGDSTYTGELVLRQDDGSAAVQLLKVFPSNSFSDILMGINDKLQAFPIERVIMERTDRQGLLPVIMDAPTMELLKQRPLQALQLLGCDISKFVSEKDGTLRTAPPPLRAGHDTIAETIGSVVYCRQRLREKQIEVECPLCGMWTRVDEDVLSCKEPGGRIVLLTLLFVEGWAILNTVDLLGVEIYKYYLPRGFNPKPPWLTKKDLQALHADWLQLVKEI